MLNQAQFNRAMLGYALWVAIEETLRNWLAKRLIDLFGSKWDEQFPVGVWNKLLEKYNEQVKPSNLSQAREILEYTDFPDLFDIIRFRKQTKSFMSVKGADELDYYSHKLYTLRNQIAHKPYGFNMRHLDDLIECADWILEFVGAEGDNLRAVKVGIEKQPEAFALEIPQSFIITSIPSQRSKLVNNLPPMDYEYDGGFVGRRSESQDVQRRLLDKRIHPIITISGAGGVGKTALAHYVCEDVLANHTDSFDGLVWISAKKDKLTLTGIEEIEPTARSFEEVLNAILTTFGFDDYLDSETNEKQRIIQEIIIDSANLGILLVVDNLETIMRDEELAEFIKDIPLPNKVLITSRLGLGEIERRIPLKELSVTDAINLFRRIAIEKSAKGLAQLSNDVISTYVQRMSGYPLVIKWVVGQAALNMDIDRLVQTINSTGSEISKFCFEYIFDEMLSENAKLILCCLASSEQDLTQAVLMHVTNFDTQTFEDTMRELELASLIVPSQQNDLTQQRIVTRYGILPLTRGYLNSKQDSQQEIRARLQSVQNLVEESKRAVRYFQFSLDYLGAVTDEELIATKHVQTALNRNHAGDYEGAIEALRRAEQIAPSFAGVFRTWAVIEGNNGNYDRAVDLFGKAAILNKDDATTWYYWGELEKKRTNYPDARKYLNRALELAEDKSPVLVALGNVEKQDSNFKQAVDLFEDAIKIAIENSRAITDKGVIVAYTSLAETYRRWAEIYDREKQLDVAIEKAKIGYETMHKVMDLGSSDVKAVEVQMECGLQLGKLHRNAGNIEGAKEILGQVVNLSPSRSWSLRQRNYVTRACYHMTLLLIDEGRYDEASKIYGHGLKCMSSTDNIRERYEKAGALLSRQKRFEGVFVYVSEKKFGFIKCAEFPENVFAHLNDFADEVSGEGFMHLLDIWVSFSLGQTDKGPAAKLIRILRFSTQYN